MRALSEERDFFWVDYFFGFFFGVLWLVETRLEGAGRKHETWLCFFFAYFFRNFVARHFASVMAGRCVGQGQGRVSSRMVVMVI